MKTKCKAKRSKRAAASATQAAHPRPARPVAEQPPAAGETATAMAPPALAGAEAKNRPHSFSPAPRASPSGTAKPRRALSAVDAAARVLGELSGKESAQGLSVKDLIGRMHSAGLWTSPNGRTPEASLYAGMVREIANKPGSARFRKVAPGRFAAASISAEQADVLTKEASRPVRLKKVKASK